MRDFYTITEFPMYPRVHSLTGFLPWTIAKAAFTVLFFAGLSLLPPLFMARRVFLDRRIRFLVVCVLVLAGGMAIEIFLTSVLCGAVHRGLLCGGIANDAAPSGMEDGKKPGWPGNGAADDRGLRCDGRCSGDCRAASSGAAGVGPRELEPDLVWAATFWHGAGAD